MEGDDELRLILQQKLKYFRVGEHPFNEHYKKQNDLYNQLGFLEPDTMMSKIAEIDSDIKIEEIAEYAQELFDMLNEVINDSVVEENNRLREFLIISRSVADKKVLLSVLSNGLNFDKIRQSGRLCFALNQLKKDSFEKKVRVVNEILLDSFETWYKPLLKAIVQIDKLINDKSHLNVPNTIGALVNEAWISKTIPFDVTDQYLRIIRNSIAHHNVKIDYKAYSVTYINIKNSGVKERTRNFSVKALEDFIFKYFIVCRYLTTELRRCRRLLLEEKLD